MTKDTIFWLRSAGLLAVLAISWGSAFLMIDVALDELTPTQLTAGRIGVATLFFTVIVLWHHDPLPRGLRPWLFIAGVCVAGNVLPFWLINWGQQHVNSGTAATIMGFVPLATAGFAHFFLKDEKFTWRKAVGIAVGFGGILTLFGLSGLIDAGAESLAQLAILGAALGYAITNIFAGKLDEHAAHAIGFGAMWMGTAILIPAAMAEGAPIETLSWETTGAVAYVGLVSTALPTIVLLYLVRTAGATFTAYANYLVPVIGVFLGVLFLGEVLNARALVALGLVLAGIALGQLGKKEQK